MRFILATSKKQCWHFPNNGGGLAAGFNDSSMDTFKGHRLSALVREIIQNSLDARENKEDPVVINFQISSIKSADLPEINDLLIHLEKAKLTAEIQDDELAKDFYLNAKEIATQKEVQFLAIHDSNTTGLTGPLEGPKGAWFALTKGSGLTQKRSGSSLGSFGHGSKAPFVSGSLRSLFYLSVLDAGKSQEQVRFQGKSILQSYVANDKTGEMTQGTGFFGNPKNCLPLTNADVPTWALSMRASQTSATGTSILIPGSLWTVESLSSISITSIANFFYAIWKGVLEVQIGTLERLTSRNVVEKFWSYYNRLEEPFIEIDRESIVDAFQSIKTIVDPTKHGEQQVLSFGRIDWYLRLDEEIESRSVAVARGNGMLITKKAPDLKRFPNLKPFDFFVCVTDGDGSQILKSTENPEHTNFEFDRIDDIKKRNLAKKKYDTFQKEVRSILKINASYSTSEQIIIDDLQELFNEISDDVESSGGSIERGKKIQIASGSYSFKPRLPDAPNPTPGDGDPDNLPGRGDRSGDKKKKTEGGTMPADEGKLKVIGPSKMTPHSDDSPKFANLQNIRMRPSQTNKGEATIYFDAALDGAVSIRLIRAGESMSEPLSILLDGVAVTAFDVHLEKNKRASVTVNFVDSDIDFALEGEAYEVKS